MERTEIIGPAYNITKEGVEKKYLIKQVISQIMNFAKTAFTTNKCALSYIN